MRRRKERKVSGAKSWVVVKRQRGKGRKSRLERVVMDASVDVELDAGLNLEVVLSMSMMKMRMREEREEKGSKTINVCIPTRRRERA